MKLSIFQYLPFLFSVFKTFFLQSKHSYRVKNFNKTKEKIDTIEHMLVKVEKRIRETRSDIEELRKQVLFSRVINLILFMILIALVIFR